MIDERIVAELKATYRNKTPRSRQLFERARSVLPGGDTRAATYFSPYPAAVQEGHGCRVVDIDGNTCTDLLNNYSSLVAGHAHPEVVEAVERQLPRGTAFAAPNEWQVELAAEIVSRLQAADSVRFTNSGTEAVMWCLRVARVVTGRSLVVKAYGGYHGSHEAVEQWASPGMTPPGGLHDHASHVRIARYNDVGDLTRIFEESGSDIAALVVEPVLGSAGVIPASSDYLQSARSLCSKHGALLVFDEVITFRLSRGGRQRQLGIAPDLTALGKIIGGGFPVGALAGARDHMTVLDPRKGLLAHSGTFNGNPVTMLAGLATLKLLDDDAYVTLAATAEALERGFGSHLEGSPFAVVRVGSLLQILAGEPQVPEPPAVPKRAAIEPLHLALYLEGIHSAPRGFMNTSLALTGGDVSEAIDAFGRAARRLLR